MLKRPKVGEVFVDPDKGDKGTVVRVMDSEEVLAEMERDYPQEEIEAFKLRVTTFIPLEDYFEFVVEYEHDYVGYDWSEYKDNFGKKGVSDMRAKCDGCERPLDIQLPEPDQGIRLVCAECAKSQNEKLFVNQRVITIGITERLSDEEMQWIWHELRARHRLYGKHLSYLQVFYIRQKKVWVLDDGSVTTMLLPEEY